MSSLCFSNILIVSLIKDFSLFFFLTGNMVLWLVCMDGQLNGWMYKRSYLEIERHYQGLGERSDVIVTHSCNFLDITLDYGVLFLEEGVYRLCLHHKYFDFMKQSNVGGCRLLFFWSPYLFCKQIRAKVHSFFEWNFIFHLRK